jgi:hypothetical protein
MAMSKYSDFFLLSSPEYTEIGEKLRLRKYQSWLAEETWMREEQNKRRAQFTLKTIQLARHIAKVKGIPEEDAFGLLQEDTPERSELLSEFSEDTSRLMNLVPSGREQFESLVTLFFRNRGEVFDGKKWKATDDWEKDDTNKLPQALLQKIEGFMAEENGALQGDEEEEQEAPK